MLHWVMDVVFHDDLMRLRTENGPANMATMRHAALNIIRAIPEKASLNVKRKTAAWDEDQVLRALRGLVQEGNLVPVGCAPQRPMCYGIYASPGWRRRMCHSGQLPAMLDINRRARPRRSMRITHHHI
jgi:hypothetical protein